MRAIEDAFFCGDFAAELVANQALDFHKQDGITEIDEATQAPTRGDGVAHWNV